MRVVYWVGLTLQGTEPERYEKFSWACEARGVDRVWSERDAVSTHKDTCHVIG